MFRTSAVATFILAASGVAALSGEQTNVLGRATVEYDEDGVYAVVAYDYSWLHHAEPWLLIHVGLMSKTAAWITRDDFTLAMPDGRVVETPSIAEWRRNAVSIVAMLARSRSVMRPTIGNMLGCRLWMNGSHRDAGDLGRSDRCEFGRFWPRRAGTVISRSMAVNAHRPAVTEVIFGAPDGVGWPSGDYTLTIRIKDRAVRVPLGLP